jgi:hypothetical protein
VDAEVGEIKKEGMVAVGLDEQALVAHYATR